MNSSFDNFDTAAHFDPQSQGGWDFGDLLDSLGHSFFHSETSAGPEYGTPGRDSHDWVPQTTGFTCAVVSQEMILHEFGVNASEAKLEYEALSHGWLNGGGTSMEDMARLLELHGVPAHEDYHGTVDALVSELAQGHKVIVAVDHADLWDSSFSLSHLFHSPKPDHAIVVTGLDMSNPAHPSVVVNDPGVQDGAGNVYPLDQFLESWHASGNMYVATDIAPPHLVDNTTFGANFNATSGMYMDTSFWRDFLANLAGTIKSELSSQLGVDWKFGESAASMINPWDKMSAGDRNDLFLQV